MEKTLGHLGRIVMPESDSPNLPAGNLGLINTLLGISRPAWKDDVPKTIDGAGVPVQWYGEKLNDSQKEAIGFCLKAEHVVCIHGPPGVSRRNLNHILRIDWKNAHFNRIDIPTPLSTSFRIHHPTTPYPHYNPVQPCA